MKLLFVITILSTFLGVARRTRGTPTPSVDLWEETLRQFPGPFARLVLRLFASVFNNIPSYILLLRLVN